MRKEWILTDEEKRLKRRKIERNRLIKQQAHTIVHSQHHQNNPNIIHSNFQPNISSLSSIEVCLSPSPRIKSHGLVLCSSESTFFGWHSILFSLRHIFL